jgi:hypothetical protein
MNFLRANVIPSLCLGTILVGCGSGSVQMSASLPEETKLNGASLEFSTTLYPLLSDHCSSCHSTVQAPFFAIVNDPLTSYNNVSAGQYVDSTTPENSKIVLKVAGNHNCWSGNCTNDSNALLAVIKKWFSSNPASTPPPPSSNNGELPTIITAEVIIPVAGATVAGNILTFSLANVGTGLPADASLQITAKQFDANNYSITKLQIKSSVALAISQVQVILNGKEIANDAFQTVDWTTSPFLSNSAYKDVSPASVVTPIGYNGGAGIGGDKLRVGFKILTNYDPAKLRWIDFIGVVQNSCANCHKTVRGATPAFGNFTTEAEFLNVASAGGKKLLVPRDSANSTIYIYSAPGTPDPMPQTGIQATIYNKLKAYIDGL